jgi:hypothetical protein
MAICIHSHFLKTSSDRLSLSRGVADSRYEHS